jgi:hypothetical protein
VFENDVFLHCVDGARERLGPVRRRDGPRLMPPRLFHHLVGDAAKEQSIGPADTLGGVLMCRLALNYENAIQAIPDASAGT